MQQRCVVPLPMPVPLPFPRLFGPAVGCYGDVLSHHPTAARAPQQHHQQQQQPRQQQPSHVSATANGSSTEAVVSDPEITRLAATQQFRAVLLQQRRQFGSAAGVHQPLLH